MAASDDVVQLRRELKDWERAFREQNGGRDPTKEDTKRDAAIGVWPVASNSCTTSNAALLVFQRLNTSYGAHYPRRLPRRWLQSRKHARRHRLAARPPLYTPCTSRVPKPHLPNPLLHP